MRIKKALEERVKVEKTFEEKRRMADADARTLSFRGEAVTPTKNVDGGCNVRAVTFWAQNLFRNMLLV